MATLANGIITLEFGATDWITSLNSNIQKMYTVSEVTPLFSGKALSTHTHPEYMLATDTVILSDIAPILQAYEYDLRFTDSAKGFTMIDTTTSTRQRIYIDNGVISVEAV